MLKICTFSGLNIIQLYYTTEKLQTTGNSWFIHLTVPSKQKGSLTAEQSQKSPLPAALRDRYSPEFINSWRKMQSPSTSLHGWGCWICMREPVSDARREISPQPLRHPDTSWWTSPQPWRWSVRTWGTARYDRASQCSEQSAAPPAHWSRCRAGSCSWIYVAWLLPPESAAQGTQTVKNNCKKGKCTHKTSIWILKPSFKKILLLCLPWPICSPQGLERGWCAYEAGPGFAGSRHRNSAETGGLTSLSPACEHPPPVHTRNIHSKWWFLFCKSHY